MALSDLLYRCPLCGTDPITGGPGADEVKCTDCGARFSWEGTGSRVRVVLSDSDTVTEPAVRVLTDRIAAMGGALSRAETPGGGLACRARIRCRWVTREAAVRYRRSLVGFRELLGRAGTEAILTLDTEKLTVYDASHATDLDLPGNLGTDLTTPETVETPGRAPLDSWLLSDINALQAMTSALQLSLVDDRVVLLAFEEDSARRWDDLVRAALQRRWAALGRGVIVEFQPRIRTAR